MNCFFVILVIAQLSLFLKHPHYCLRISPVTTLLMSFFFFKNKLDNIWILREVVKYPFCRWPVNFVYPTFFFFFFYHNEKADQLTVKFRSTSSARVMVGFNSSAASSVITLMTLSALNLYLFLKVVSLKIFETNYEQHTDMLSLYLYQEHNVDTSCCRKGFFFVLLHDSRN